MNGNTGISLRQFNMVWVILLLALVVRLPGLLFGVKLSAWPVAVHGFRSLHIDEENLARIAHGFIDREDLGVIRYPKGFPVQMALAAFLTARAAKPYLFHFILIGRCLSLLYGIATVLVLYCLATEIFAKKTISLLAGLFLALAGLHVTESHYATADAGNTFWIYATILFCLWAIRKKDIFLCLAVITGGYAIAFKFSVAVLVPIIYVLILQKKDIRYWILVGLAIFSVFTLANGGWYPLSTFRSLFEGRVADQPTLTLHYNSLINPLAYFVQLLPAVGLPIFISFFLAFRSFHFKKFHEDKNLRDVFFVLILPILLYYVIVCFVSIPFPRYPFSRHLLVGIPLFVLVAAYGSVRWVERIKWGGEKRLLHKVVALFIVYQLIFVGQIEYYFVFDTITSSEKWVRTHIPPTKKIAAFCWMWPKFEFKNKVTWLSPKSRYRPFLFLHETSFFRYLRSPLNLFDKFPSWTEIYHGNYFHFIFVQALFKDQLPYALVKKFEVKAITPEMFLYKKIWGTFPLFLGDVLIYRKVEAPKHRDGGLGSPIT